MKYIKQFIVVFTVLICLLSVSQAQNNYINDVQAWREKVETDLKSDSSWLTLAGLFWLKEGINTIGSDAGNDIKLPISTAEKVGTIEFKNGVLTLSLNVGVNAVSDGKPITKLVINSDEKGKPTVIQIGDVNFTVIKRENRFGVRVKDKNNPARKNFTGLRWFAIGTSFKINARFEAYDEPKEIEIPNVLGGTFTMKSPGLLRFKLNGKEYSLVPVEEGDQLFTIFSDLTSRKTTYQAGRFLYATKPKNGEVFLDFNKAHNPPCAFTEFATCPLPPPQNRLKTEIRAGEKRYDN